MFAQCTEHRAHMESKNEQSNLIYNVKMLISQNFFLFSLFFKVDNS